MGSVALLSESFEFTAVDRTRLVGTLARPDRSGPAPATLLISGSARSTGTRTCPARRCTSPARLPALAACGVASLRFDKRDIGESGGDYLTTGFDEETDDAGAALEALRNSPAAEAQRLTVIGHSVGATIAIRLASRGHDLAGLMLLAASRQPGAQVMRRQSERIVATMRGPSRLLSSWVLRRQSRTRERLLASTDDVTRIGRTDFPARRFHEFMTYDLLLISDRFVAHSGNHRCQRHPGRAGRRGGHRLGSSRLASPVGFRRGSRMSSGNTQGGRLASGVTERSSRSRSTRSCSTTSRRGSRPCHGTNSAFDRTRS